MRRLQSCCLLLAVLVVTPTFAWGQGWRSDAYLSATYDGTAMQLRLSVRCEAVRGNAVAFDVFRRTTGYECGSEERVTDQPTAWPVTGVDEVFEVSFTDPDVTPNTAYRYEARPVDAERNPAQDECVGSIWGHGVVGVALLAHGQLSSYDNFQVILEPCPGECFATGLVCGSDIAQWGTTLNLYGNSVTVSRESNLWFPRLYITSTSLAPCHVDVEPVGWSALKQLYK